MTTFVPLNSFLPFLLFLGVVGTIQSERYLSVFESAELIKSVSDHFDVISIALISSQSESSSQKITLEKLLNKPLKYFIGIWDLTFFIRNFYSNEVYDPPKTLIVVESTSQNLQKLSWISKRISIASYIWLFLSTPAQTEESIFINIEIPINCQFLSYTAKEDLVELNEIYRVSKYSKLLIQRFGFWTLKKGLHNVTGELYDKRKNLNGHEFKFAVHNVSGDVNPCKSTLQIDNGKQMIQCVYFEIWKYLGELLNYTTKHVVLEDCYQNGTNGLSTPMLEMIQSGGADSGLDGYIWSSSRLVYNQFLWPLFHSKVILVTKTPARKFSISSYVRPFVTNMWLALIGWLLLSGIIVNCTKYFTKKPVLKRNFLTRSEIIENSFVPLTAICYQGSGIIPQRTAIRLAYLMIYIIPVVFIPSYSGSIISSLSVPSANVPFFNLNEFEEDGTYTLSAVNNTFFQLLLMTDDKLESLRRKKLISTTFSDSYKTAFHEICSKRVTFMFEWPLLTKHSIHCNVFMLDQTMTKIFSSMAVQKHFPYMEIFNRQIQKLVCSGLNIKMVEKKTLEVLRHKINPFPTNYFQIKPFGFGDVLPLFAVLLGGMFLSLILLFIERYHMKKKIKERKWGNSNKEFTLQNCSNSIA